MTIIISFISYGKLVANDMNYSKQYFSVFPTRELKITEKRGVELEKRGTLGGVEFIS